MGSGPEVVAATCWGWHLVNGDLELGEKKEGGLSWEGSAGGSSISGETLFISGSFCTSFKMLANIECTNGIQILSVHLMNLHANYTI